MRISDCSSDVCSSDLPEAASLFSAVVTLSMVTTPFLMLFARNLEFAPGTDELDLDDPGDAPRGSAIVVGYGRFGQIVSQMLHGVACSVTLIDKKQIGRASLRVRVGQTV